MQNKCKQTANISKKFITFVALIISQRRVMLVNYEYFFART